MPRTSKRDLFETLSSLQSQISLLRDQNSALLNACRLAVEQPHARTCWTMQRNPGPICTCHLKTLKSAIAKVEDMDLAKDGNGGEGK